MDVCCVSCCGGAIWWMLTKERQAWCCLQVKLCDPCLSALCAPWCKMALYKYSSFPVSFTVLWNSPTPPVTTLQMVTYVHCTWSIQIPSSGRPYVTTSEVMTLWQDENVYIGWQWRNFFMQYLYVTCFPAMMWGKLWEMFVIVLSLFLLHNRDFCESLRSMYILLLQLQLLKMVKARKCDRWESG